MSTLRYEKDAGRCLEPQNGAWMRATQERAWLVSARRYGIAAALCAVFSGVYEYFSHGVLSAWMLLLFAFPLVLGVIPALLGAVHHVRRSLLASQLWACGVMTLAMGSCLAGVFEIYGTASSLVWPYAPAGTVLLALAGLTQMRCAAADR